MNDLITEDNQNFAQTELSNHNDTFSTNRQTAHGEKYIVFYLDEKLYAVSARQVVEVIQPMTITPLPKAPDWLSGIINLRGRIISVINLSKLWKEQPAVLTHKSKLILLRSVNGEAAVTFAVDKLTEITDLPNDMLKSIKTKDAPYLLGKITYKSEDLYLIDADKIYSFICFCLETGH
ncbi:MAG: chemotaxis protein CheW [Pyrinomonadaceae bacterium]